MKWKEFEESKIEIPDETVEKIIEGFSNATKKLVELGLIEKSVMSRLAGDKFGTKFQFEVILLSKRLNDYSFTVFEFGYDINLYPVKVLINKSILDEMINKGEFTSNIAIIENEEKFKKVIELIFETNKFREIVSSLMKIASKRDEDELPF